MFWSSTGILNDKARDWSKIVIGLLACCRTPLVLQNSPATAINNPDYRRGITIRTLKFCRKLAKFEDLCVIHVGEYCYDSSLNLLISCFWLMSFRNCFLCRCFFEHLDKFCDVVLSPCILQFHRWDRYTWYSIVSSVASGFFVALRILLRFPRWSCFWYK